MKRPTLVSLGRLSSDYRDEISRVALGWTGAILAISAATVLLRSQYGPAPDYRAEVTMVFIVVVVSLIAGRRLPANGRCAVSIGLFAFAGASTLLKAGPAGHAPFYLSMAVTLAGLFYGMRGWVFACLINAGLVGVIGTAVLRGWVETHYLLPDFLRTPPEYLLVATMVVLVSLLLLQVVRVLVTQRILFLDDEMVLAQMGRKMLERLSVHQILTSPRDPVAQGR